MSAKSFESLFNPGALKSLSHFEWAIRAVARGAFIGNRRSQRTGTGQEFSQYRPYTQGDDIRRLDWKMYGRSERFYIKESEVETDVSIWFVLDDSLSMTYEEEGLSKFDFSRLFIGYLAYLSLLVGDSFGLVTSGRVLKAGHGEKQWKRFVHLLYDASPTDHLDLDMPTLRGREVVCIFSDLYDDHGDITPFVHSLKTRRNEVLTFHVLGSREKRLAFEGAVTFQDLEAGGKVQLTPGIIADSYRQHLRAWTESLKTAFAGKGIDYREAILQQDPTPLVQQFIFETSRLR